MSFGYLLTLSFISIIYVLLIPSTKVNHIRAISIFFSGLIFLYSLVLWFNFDYLEPGFQFRFSILHSEFETLSNFAIDGISLFYIILSTFLIFICLLESYAIQDSKHIKSYVSCFLVLNLLLISVFSALDILFFYVLFETILIPMFLVIGLWGSRERKIRAAYLFFFYTLVGSLLMLLAIIYIFSESSTTNYESLLVYKFSEIEQKWLWLAFFASFASKIPMFPFHIWLPEAHVEAPTAGSVLLAGILLKLGSYGFIRYSLTLFPEASLYFSPFVYLLAILGIIFTSLTAIRQTDFKRIIAYSSIAHMNVVMLGLFSFNVVGLEGAFLQSLSHGLVASGLFLIIGILYSRHHSRLIYYYSGLAQLMPIYATVFLFFTMANIALPGTSSFVGEFLILTGIYQFNTTTAFLGATAMILGGAYSLWLYNRISFGNVKMNNIEKFTDLNYREFLSLLPLILGVLVMGIYPKVFLNPIHATITSVFGFFFN